MLIGCTNPHPEADMNIYEQQLNKVTEARIDSAYQVIQKHCDSMMQYGVPKLVDSIIKTSHKK